MRNTELPMSFCSLIFRLIVFVNENAENKILFVTQFVFYLMVPFVRATNKGKVTNGKKKPLIFYIQWTFALQWLQLELCERSLITLHTTQEQFLLTELSRHYGLLFMKTFYNVVNSAICCIKEVPGSVVLNIAGMNAICLAKL